MIQTYCIPERDLCFFAPLNSENEINLQNSTTAEITTESFISPEFTQQEALWSGGASFRGLALKLKYF